MKIIVFRNAFLFFTAFLFANLIYGQTEIQQTLCPSPHIPNQLILSFKPGISLITINNRLIHGQVIKSVPADPGVPLNIHLVAFTQNPGIYDLNGISQIFNTVEDLLVYLEQNEACNSGTNGTGVGAKRVVATDLNYTYTVNSSNSYNNYNNNYNINNYLPAPDCGNIPMVANVNNLNNPMKIVLIDGGITDGLNYNELFNQNPNYDFVDNDNTPNALSNHGDKVAAVTAATLSTAAGSSVNSFFDLFAYKVLDEENTGELFDVILAVHRAVENETNIINLSLGVFFCPFDVCSVVLDAVFQYADDNQVIIIAAAGNDHSNINTNFSFNTNTNYTNESFYIPASLPNTNMIVVGATENCLNNIAYFSNYGSENVDFFAEGNRISSNLGFVTGTSFAAPYVAAAAALAGAKMQDYNHEAVICAILESTDYKGWDDKCTTGGVLNVLKALNHDCLNSFNTTPTTRQNTQNVPSPLSPIIHPFFSSNERLNISINAMEEGLIDINVFSITGKLIRTEKFSLVKGSNDLHIGHLNQVPNGLYIVQSIIGNEIISKKCYKSY